MKSRQLTALKARIETLPRQLTLAAKYIIDHPGDFGIDPIRVSADKIGVSANTLVRLAQQMGHDSFESLRAPFRAALVTDREDILGEDWIEQLSAGDAFAQKQAQLARNEINVITRSMRLMTPDKIERTIRTMLGARRCFVTATRASYALAYYFHYVGRMALPGLSLVPRYMGSAVDELLNADENDCLLAITFAPYSAETIQAMRFAQSRGAQLILISDSELVAPNIKPDIVLKAATQSQHHLGCYVGVMAVLECLLGHLVNAAGEEGRERIANYEAMRDDTGAYWKAGRLPKIRP